jgi:hypothetical protein
LRELCSATLYSHLEVGYIWWTHPEESKTSSGIDYYHNGTNFGYPRTRPRCPRGERSPPHFRPPQRQPKHRTPSPIAPSLAIQQRIGGCSAKRKSAHRADTSAQARPQQSSIPRAPSARPPPLQNQGQRASPAIPSNATGAFTSTHEMLDCSANTKFERKLTEGHASARSPPPIGTSYEASNIIYTSTPSAP